MHEIIHGDCANVLPTLERKADLILTSPPYDDLREYGGHGFDFDRVADACVGALAEGGVIVWVVADATVNGSETGTSFRQALGFMERGLKLHDTMIYRYKGSTGRTYDRRMSNGFEFMFVFSLGEHKTFHKIIDRHNVSGGKLTAGKTQRGKNGELTRREPYVIPHVGPRDNVWDYARGGSNTTSSSDEQISVGHPARYPFSLAKDHIRTWTNAGDLVIDPMAGSGTTLRAAKDLGRDSIGIEIHEPYVDIIRRRMAQEVLGI